MNRQQLVEIVKGLLVAGGPVVILMVNLLGMEQGPAEKIVSALAALVSVGGIVWMAMGKSDTAMTKDAASLPGVQVHAQPGVAPPAVVEVARDPKVSDVVVMSGGPVPNKPT
jgi:hypothetical protein